MFSDVHERPTSIVAQLASELAQQHLLLKNTRRHRRYISRSTSAPLGQANLSGVLAQRGADVDQPTE